MPRCNFCGRCIGLCLSGALTSDYESGRPIFNESKCTQCSLCYLHCQVIKVNFSEFDTKFHGRDKFDNFLKSYKKCFFEHSADD